MSGNGTLLEDDEVSAYSKQVAKGTAWSLSGNMLFHLISFFYVILIARSVSQDDLGLFFLSMSIISVSSIFDNLGLGSAFTRYIPYYLGKGEKGKILSLLKMSYAIVTVVGIVMVAVVWLLADLLSQIYQNPQLAEVIRLLSAYLLLSNIFNLNNSYLNGRADIKAMKISQTSQNVLKLAFTALLFYLLGPSVFVLVIAFLLSVVVSIAISGIFVMRSIGDFPSHEEGVSFSLVLHEILPFGLMMTLIISAGTIFSSANRMLLGYLVDPAEMTQIIAVYAVSATLASLLLTLPRSIGEIFLPVISRLYGKNDIGQMREVAQTSQRWAMFLALPFGVVFISLSGDLLSLVYGEPYRGGALVMSILSAAYVLRAISLMMSLALSAMKKLDIQLKVSVMSGALQILIGLALIPILGMVGAAIGLFVGFVVTLVLMTHYSRVYFDFHIPPEIYKLMGAGLATLGIMMLLTPYTSAVFTLFPEHEPLGLGLYLSKLVSLGYVGLLSGVSMSVFLVFTLFLKCFKKEDVSMMRKSLQKARVPKAIISAAERISSYGIAD